MFGNVVNIEVMRTNVEKKKKKQGRKATVHFGSVGINDDRPTEALSVHGNVQVLIVELIL